MPKIKTHKGAAKRLKKTGTGKIMVRHTGQDHFNSRNSGNVGTRKRRDNTLTKSNPKLGQLIPYK
jgi:large subunit ribosomal protein L35